MIEMSRRTVAKPIRFHGSGLHSGQEVEVTLEPGSKGIVFAREGAEVPAVPSAVKDTSRCTALENVSTVEHLMAALAAAEVTDVQVNVKGQELPGLDGSAVKFLDALLEVGFEALPDGSVSGLSDLKLNQEGIAIEPGSGQYRYIFDAGNRWPGRSEFSFNWSTEGFWHDVAPARTFAFEHELEAIRKAGLGQGLDESSALVLGEHGYVNEARFDDEHVRHKLLDLIGDLYLTGIPLKYLNVRAEKTGHRANVAAARAMVETVKISRPT
jgi:UDP-3-O-acyl N-acetylglucosamine deacetylase